METQAPADRDWKSYLEPGWRDLSHTIFLIDCPGCEKHVGALIVDGPDPVFADLVCPLCSHEWNERVS